MKHNFRDLTNQKFTHLLVLKQAEDKISASGKHYVQWLCKCDCGNTKKVLSSSLLHKRSPARSCGCIKINLRGKAHMTHGHSKRYNQEGSLKCSSTYHSYTSMITRCYNSNHKSYKGYGSRGIRVCKRWQGKGGFERFLKDLGERPKNKTLDRKNPNKNYTPKNCRWATGTEQVLNRRHRSEWEKGTHKFYFNPVRSRLRAVVANET